MSKYSKVISTKVITSFEDFYQLKKEWDELIDDLPEYLPTMTYEWHRAWLEVNRSKIKKIHFILFKDLHGHLVGIVPLVRIQTKLLFKQINVYTFSGSRDLIKTSIIHNQEHRIQILLEVLYHFYNKHHDWDLIAFRRLATNYADQIFLERILNKYQWRYSVESHLKVPYIILEGTYEDYFKSRKKHFRHEIRRKTRQLEKLGNLSYQVLDAPIKESHFNQFVELENKGWKGKNKSSLLNRPTLYNLFKALSTVNTPHIKMVLFKLYLDDKLISASICFQTKNSLHVFKIAYDEDFKRQSPGLLLRLFEIQEAFNRNLEIYDFSGKEERWMHAFTERKHHVVDYIIYRKTMTAFIRYIGFIRFKPFLKRIHLLERILKNLIEE